jgi:hypothetical protein
MHQQIHSILAQLIIRLSQKNNNRMNNLEKEIYAMVYDVEKLRILNTCAKEMQGVFSLIS